jgi:uncharacterized protein YceK
MRKLVTLAFMLLALALLSGCATVRRHVLPSGREHWPAYLAVTGGKDANGEETFHSCTAFPVGRPTDVPFLAAAPGEPPAQPEHTLYVTAAHCVYDVPPPLKLKLLLVGGGGVEEQAEIVAKGNPMLGDDYLLVRAKFSTPYRISTQPVGYGDRVSIEGFIDSHGLLIAHGEVTIPSIVNMEAQNGAVWDGFILAVLAGGSGMSGAPVLDKDGRVVGIYIGQDNGVFAFVLPIGRVLEKSSALRNAR